MQANKKPRVLLVAAVVMTLILAAFLQVQGALAAGGKGASKGATDNGPVTGVSVSPPAQTGFGYNYGHDNNRDGQKDLPGLGLGRNDNGHVRFGSSTPPNPGQGAQ